MKKIILFLIIFLIISISFINSKTQTLKERIESAVKIYFLPLETKKAIANIKALKPPTTEENALTLDTMITLDNNVIIRDIEFINEKVFDEFNTKLFERLKTILGEKLIMIPEEYIIERTSFGTIHREYDTKNMNCNFYIYPKIRSGGEETYSIEYNVRDKYYETGKLVPVDTDYIYISMYENTHKLIKWRLVANGFSLIMGKHNDLLIDTSSGTSGDKENKTDHFRWSYEYVHKKPRLKNDFKAFLFIISENFPKRMEKGILNFEEIINKKISK